MQLGLTLRGLEDVGDVHAVTPAVAENETVQSGQELLRIEWSAMKISDGDELYHTTWANVEGELVVVAPFPCTVAAVNAPDSIGPAGLDEAEWLVELAASEADAQQLELLSEAEYLAQAGTGLFGESDEALSYTSYG